MKRLLPLALLAVLTACDSALVPESAGTPYEYRTATNPAQVLRWPSGATIRIYVAGSESALRDALADGAAAWNRHALFGEYHVAETTDLGAADVVLRWNTESGTVDFSACAPSGSRAVTTFCAADDDLSAGLAVFPRSDGGASRVRMLVTVLASEASVAGSVERLVAHELGHVLGIMRHSTTAADLMYGQTLQTSVPAANDVATVRLLYQVPPDIVP